MKYEKRKKFLESLDSRLYELKEAQAQIMEDIEQEFTVEKFRRLNLINQKINVTQGRKCRSWREIILSVHVSGIYLPDGDDLTI